MAHDDVWSWFARPESGWANNIIIIIFQFAHIMRQGMHGKWDNTVLDERQSVCALCGMFWAI